MSADFVYLCGVMSRRVVENTKRPTEGMDTVPEVQAGWRKPNSREVGIHARGICSIHRQGFVNNIEYFDFSLCSLDY